MVNPGLINHVTILELYKKYVDPNHTYTLISMDELVGTYTCTGRSNCMLSTKKLESLFPIQSIQTGIEQVMKKYAASLRNI